MSRGGRPRLIESPEEFAERADTYFAECVDQGLPITVTGLALAVGFVSRQSLHDYEIRPEFSDTVKRARLFVEHAYECRLGEAKPTGAIFALKQMGWRDATVMEVSGRDGKPIELTAVPTDELQTRAVALAGKVVGQIPASTNGNGTHG